jgi:hypothetical protein
MKSILRQQRHQGNNRSVNIKRRNQLGAVVMAAGLFVACVRQPAQAADSFTLRIEPLDAGQYDSALRISTPWGDYAALIQHDGTAIVETYKAYEHSRVVGISTDLGFRVSKVKESGATESFVQAGSLHAEFKTGSIDGVTPEADFQSQSGIKDATWLDIIWQQNVPGIVECTVWNPKLRKIVPFQQIDDSQPPFHDVSLILPNAWFSKPVAILCATAGSAPAVMPVRSLAKLDYELSTDARSGLPADPKQEHHLAGLLKLDPSIAMLASSPPSERSQPSGDTGEGYRPEVSPPTPSATPTPLPLRMAGSDELQIARVLSSSSMVFLYLNVHPKDDAYFNSSNVELTLTDGTIVHGDGFPVIKIRANDHRTLMVQFQKGQGRDFSGGKVRWYYRTLP